MIIKLPWIKVIVPHKKYRLIFGDNFTKVCIWISPFAVIKIWELIKPYIEAM